MKLLICKLAGLMLVLIFSNASNAEDQKQIQKVDIDIQRYEKSQLLSPLTSLKIPIDKNQEAISLYNLAIMNSGRNSSKAKEFLTQSAQLGLVESQFNLAHFYLNNGETKSNEQKAIKWFKEAAERNFILAQFNLAVLLERQKKNETESKLALRWYKTASNLGFAPAQSNLGILYATGDGVEKDIEIAIKWLSKSAEQNHILSYYNLGVAYEEIAKKSSSTIYQIYAVRWYKRAALKGNLKSMLNLGLMLASAVGTQKDLKQAHTWVNVAIAIKCSQNRLSCRWNETMFKGPSNPVINHLWDLRIEIERQLRPKEIQEAGKLAKQLIQENNFIRNQIR